MFRLYFMTFRGEYRGEAPVAHHAPSDAQVAHADHAHDDPHGHDVHGHAEPHESPLSMTGVLMILAALSIIGGFIGLPAALGGAHPTWFQRWLEPVLLPIGGHAYHFHEASHALEYTLMIVSVAIAAFGIFLAYRFYLRRPAVPDVLEQKLGFVHRVLENKYWVDELYHATVIAGTIALCRVLWWFDRWIVDGIVNGVRHLTIFGFAHGSNIFDRYIVDGAVNGVAWSAKSGSMMFRRVQSGLVQNYALIMGGGIVLIALVYLFMRT
jgi:NADH-quinone oxidoreductase subunit L